MARLSPPQVGEGVEAATRYVDVAFQPLKSNTGLIIGVFVQGMDVTDRVLAETRRQALAELTDRFRGTGGGGDLSHAVGQVLGTNLKASRVGFGTIDPETETLTVERDWTSAGVESLQGSTPLREYGSFIDDLKAGQAISIGDVRTDARTSMAAGALEARHARSFVNVPVLEHGRLVAVLFVNADRSRTWTLGELDFIKEAAERTRTAVERSRNETELNRSQALLLALNASLEDEVAQRTAERNSVWNQSRDLVGIATYDGYLKSINPAWSHALGRSEAELLSRPFAEIIHPDDLAVTGEVVATLQRGEPVHQFFVRLLTADGTALNFAWSAVPDANLSLGQFNTIGRDVTAETAQAASLRLHQNIVQSDRSPVCCFDTEFRLIAFNKAHNDEFRRVNGFDTKLGDVFPDLFIAEQQPVMRALMSRALSGERFTVVEEFGRPDLGVPHWEITYTPLYGDAGEIIGAFHHARDVSARLHAEAELADAQDQLRQSQKMEAMGQLTGGVAHDFNNLLTPIVGSLDLLQRRGVGSEREKRLIDGAIQSAERARTLVQRLLAFARRQPLQTLAVDIGALVRGMGDLISSTSGPRVKVEIDVADDLPAARADANQVEMAVLNLAVNARDAMPEGGTLRISAKAATVGEIERQGLSAGEYVCLSIVDNGVGMDEATLARAVEPFFSTKGVGQGTGLGLSMVHGLAAQLGGGVFLSSKPGYGTRIELLLPASDVEADAPQEQKRQGAAAGAPAKAGAVLLVDDETLVRLSTADMLMDLGYSVIEAGSAEEALRLMDEGQEFDLLVTDHLMPGMSGTELAHSVSARRPEVPILVVSGYAEAEGVASDLARLVKPFKQSDLAAKMRVLHQAGR